MYHTDRPGFVLIKDFPEDQEYIYSCRPYERTCFMISHYFTELPHPDFDFPCHEFNSRESGTIKIDTLLVPVITSLWKAKISTQYCCAGYKNIDDRRVRGFESTGMILFQNRDHTETAITILKEHGITGITEEFNHWDSQRLHLSFDRIIPM